MKEPESDWYATPRSTPRRSRRYLVAVGLALAVGGLGTVLAQRTSSVRELNLASGAAATTPERSGRAEGETVEVIAGAQAPAAGAEAFDEHVAGAEAAPLEASLARGSGDTPAKAGRRAIRQKNVPPANVSVAASASALPTETASSAIPPSKPHLDPLDGRH
jgi:hypothetical protein